MNRTPIPSSRARLPALLIAACVSALQGASGCGRAESARLDSETHWLTSCDSDLDCGAGSCECGVCTETCSTSADCSALGLSGVECLPPSGACGAVGEGAGGASAASSAGSVCLLPCAGDNDCTALSADAVCESQRCERRASSLADGIGGSSNLGGSGGGVGVGGAGTGGTGSTGAAVLCDGSEDVRFFWAVGGGFVSEYYSFAASQGYGFLAIDGQCRFWRGGRPGSAVEAGTLSAQDAASLADELGYERFSELAPYDDQEGCPDAGSTRIWSPASYASCVCGCGAGSGGESWLPALLAMNDARLEDWLGNARPVTGPLQLALIGYQDAIPDVEPLAWPLSRAPAESEIYPVVANSPQLDESSGVEITDPVELPALRAARDAYIARAPGAEYTPLVWTDPDTQQVVWFHMLLRDQLPAPVRAALLRPLF